MLVMMVIHSNAFFLYVLSKKFKERSIYNAALLLIIMAILIDLIWLSYWLV